jgi:hypothetical protein
MADKKLLGSCRIETIVMQSQNLFMYYRLSLNMGQKCSHMRKVEKKSKIYYDGLCASFLPQQ